MSVENYLSKVKKQNMIRSNFRQAAGLLSVVIILGVFWGLKLTGITMAGEAFCGMEEHIHGDECVLQEWVCGQEEVPAHVHSTDCMNRVLQCTLQEQEGHTHSDDCREKILTCILEEREGHSHGEECRTRTLVCTAPEIPAHSHDDACHETKICCGQEESEPHRHDDSCMESALACDLPEDDEHSHGETCYELKVSCGQEETEGHRHDDSCMESVLVCELSETEGHTHEDSCYEEQQICQLEEIEGHAHGDDCYIMGEAFVCGQEESEAHFHEDACYLLEENNFVCGQEETEGHTHVEACSNTLEACPIEEHTHTPDCYSDISADLETSDIWEESFAHLIRSPSTAENIVNLALSQLECAESTRNFQVDEAGIRRGITRYGQWYGNPYGDWSAMFACFCLEYAGVMDVPVNAGPESMRLGWEEAELYLPVSEFEPVTGHLLFLDKDNNGNADAVAIITGQTENVISVVEGDLDKQVTKLYGVSLSDDESTETQEPEASDTYEEILFETHQVAQTLYAQDDPAIMGYGLVPFEPGLSLWAPGDSRTVWLDGTNGGLMSLGGSPNTSYSAREGEVFTLPTQWQSPDKYSYTLRGWYDITNSRYYAPGAEVTVTGNMVFYADWAASTYDVGRFNSQVDDTISTKDFVTVRMFDYGALFNVLSESVSIRYENNSHTETWKLLTSGNNPYNNDTTLNYILRDWDRGSEDISYPSGTNDHNNPTDAGEVYPGLYNDKIISLLFDPNTQVIGKQYLGTGDYLFQLCEDPAHDHYGYYYYNSERNAASYNQSDQRFYVYNYLECTRTSANGDYEGKYSDFLPLNSPYVNTNGKTVNTYTYAGVEGEYNGTTHYLYDCRYNDSGNSSSNVGTNFWFGMSVDIDFYLPNAPGSGGNKDVYGKDMHFRFSGDDDVWVLVDGKLVLDLGGIHGKETGDINFSTGEVTINGVVNTAHTNALKTIAAGEHTLTLYYLERGSSMSNCAIYFNLAPRFSFSIQKEDVLTRDVLNGAQFSVYTDRACTVPAVLWTSKAAHDRGESSTNVFTVTNGVANMWGMGAGNTYYIKETKPPDNEDYGYSDGIISLTFDKTGTASYNVDIVDGGQGVSGGFTVHGFRIDTETQEAYIVATNAPKWAKETTAVHARKLWDDNVNHSADSVTVYLTTTDPDGTVRRLQEVQLNNSNNWYHMWENLPKYREDGVTPITYGVEEAYISGYYSKVESVEDYNFVSSQWKTVNSLENGKTYILSTSAGYLSTRNTNSDTGFMWVDQETAQNSQLALWTVTTSDQKIKLTNGAGQSLTFYYNGGSPTDFFAYNGGESNASKQYFNTSAAGNGFRIYYRGNNNKSYYLISDTTNAQKFKFSETASKGLAFTPMTKTTTTVTDKVTGWAYLITNTPLEQETSLTVEKNWHYGYLTPGNLHEQAQVTVKLLANGKDAGRTVTLSLKNGWKDTFRGLPYTDSNGNVISYSVVEIWDHEDWIPSYGEILTTGGAPPGYTTTITNQYRWGMGGPELPSTGTAARMIYILSGGGIMLTSLVFGIFLRRKRERRML